MLFRSLFDLFDFVSSNILLPLGGVFFAWFVGWYVDKKFVDNELTNHGATKVSIFRRPLFFCIRYFAPIAIIIIFLYGLGLFDAFL